jgi:hypothetical protein
MYDTRTWTEIDLSNRAAGPLNKTFIECHRRYKDNDYVSDRELNCCLEDEVCIMGFIRTPQRGSC